MRRGALADDFWSEEGTLLLGAVISIAVVGAASRGLWRVARLTGRLSRRLVRGRVVRGGVASR